MSTTAGKTAVKIPARPEALVIVPAQTALVVVDMQHAFLSKGGYLDLVGTDVSPAARVIPAVLAVIGAARRAGLRIFYFQNGFDEQSREARAPSSPLYHKSKALKFMRNNPRYRRMLVTRGSWDFEFVEGIRPRRGETVVNKSRYSGFAGTNFDMLLRAERITTLLLVGVNTNVCVESTLRDAYHREYFALMVADATFQSGPPAMMEATIFNVQNFFGWVSTADEVCRALKSIRSHR